MPSLQAAGILIFSISWLSYDHYEPWVNFHAESLALLGVGLLGLAQCIRPRTVNSFLSPRTPLAIVLTLIGIVWIHSFLDNGSFFGDGLLVSFYLFGLALAIALGYQYANRSVLDTNLKWLFVSLTSAAMLSAIIGLMQWLNLESLMGIYAVQADVGDRPMGNMGQTNQLSTLLLLGLISLAWLHNNGYGGRLICLLCACFLTIVLALTQSRSGMLGAFVASLFLAWNAGGLGGRLSRNHYVIWLSGYLLVLALLPTVYDVLLMGGNRDAASLLRTADRFGIWKQSLAAIAQAPWLGYGWLHTPAAQAAGSLLFPGNFVFTFSHNFVLDMLLWNGIPMGLLILGMSGYWFISRLRLVSESNAVFAMGALLPLFIHSMVEYPFAYSYFLVTAGFLMGVVEAGHPHAPVTKWRLKWVTLGLGAWFVTGAMMIYEYFHLEADYRLVRMVAQGLETVPLDTQPHPVFLLTQLDALLSAARLQPSSNMTTTDLETMRQVLQRFANREIHVNYILALGLNSQPEEASRQLVVLGTTYGKRSLNIAQFILQQSAQAHPELLLVRVPF